MDGGLKRHLYIVKKMCVYITLHTKNGPDSPPNASPVATEKSTQKGATRHDSACSQTANASQTQPQVRGAPRRSKNQIDACDAGR